MGPLQGLRIIELAGIGPGPFCGMMLADMGAEVIRIDRPQTARSGRRNIDVLARGRKTLAVDLKQPAGVDLVLDLCEQADALFEGFRPGVAERMGLGPDDCLARNPRMIYGRMTGWGQQGPLAQAAGHDINYIALAGALHGIGPAGGKPVVPLNLVGDFGGGGMLLAFGMVCALLERERSGKGQVVDAAMVDGAALLMAMFYSLRAFGAHSDERGTNMLDGGAHFYDTYETSDGLFISIGAIEPQFYAQLIQKAGLDPELFAPQMDRSRWPVLKETLAKVVRGKTRAEWCALLEGTDVCFAPVLTPDEAAAHPHMRARHSFVTLDGVLQPAASPRFSRTPGGARQAAPAGAEVEDILGLIGYSGTDVQALRESGVLGT
jgi:alpha-methylacyl-CoA racemase